MTSPSPANIADSDSQARSAPASGSGQRVGSPAGGWAWSERITASPSPRAVWTALATSST